MAATKLGIVWIAIGLAVLGLAVLLHLLLFCDARYGFLLYIMLWPAGVLIFIGIAHICFPKRGVKILGKSTTNGSLPWLQSTLFFPYLLSAWIGWAVRCAYLRIKREPICSKVWDGVYVGRYPLFSSRIPDEVTVVVDLTTEFPGVYGEREYYGCFAFDTDTPDPTEWYAVATQIAKCHAKGEKILVHCAYGHGRSGVTAALAMLLASEPPKDVSSFEAARTFLRQGRPCIQWYPRQQAEAQTALDMKAAVPLSPPPVTPPVGATEQPLLEGEDGHCSVSLSTADTTGPSDK